MSVWDKILEAALGILVFFFVASLGVLALLAALALPLLGAVLAMCNPWIGVPVTVVLSLVSLAFVYMVVYWIIDEVRGV